MGTNYYLRPPGTCASECDNWIHIGKHSTGWAFTFHGYRPGELDNDYVAAVQITTIAEVLELAGTCEIYDEYGDAVPVEKLQEIIARAAAGKPHFGREYARDSAGCYWYYGDFS